LAPDVAIHNWVNYLCMMVDIDTVVKQYISKLIINYLRHYNVQRKYLQTSRWTIQHQIGLSHIVLDGITLGVKYEAQFHFHSLEINLMDGLLHS